MFLLFYADSWAACLLRETCYLIVPSFFLGVILTTPWLREFIINYSRPFIYTTALAIYNVIAVQCSLDMLESPLGRQVCTLTESCGSIFNADSTV